MFGTLRAVQADWATTKAVGHSAAPGAGFGLGGRPVGLHVPQSAKHDPGDLGEATPARYESDTMYIASGIAEPTF